MSKSDTLFVSEVIDAEKETLNIISQAIWNKPELGFKEVHAHSILTKALKEYGFNVQEHYFLETAFHAEFTGNNKKPGPTIAVLCEYDALPEIGHGCGHNLIAEVGIAASIAVKKYLESNPNVAGKLVVLGCPAEEGGGGKIRLIEKGAFRGIDAALMLHPSPVNLAFTTNLRVVSGTITYKGKESHASAFPWEGINALDAAVACYQNLSLLRQQMRPLCRIHCLIKKGGSAVNVIPNESILALQIRGATEEELSDLRKRVESCIESAAKCTGCEVEYHFNDDTAYANVITNKVLGNLIREYGESYGIQFMDDHIDMKMIQSTAGSTDMGNVSYVVPAIHSFYKIGEGEMNHTAAFTKVAGESEAQVATLTAAKALAMTVIRVMQSKEHFDEMNEDFRKVVIDKI